MAFKKKEVSTAATVATAATAATVATVDTSNIVHEGTIHEGHEAEAVTTAIHEEEFPANWTPPSNLDAPPPQSGMVQRWCRMSILGAPDPQNRARQAGQGWRPRRLSTVPEGERIRYPALNDSAWGDVIAQGALVLCEMPERLAAQRKEYFDSLRHGQMQALVDNNILPASGKGYGAVELTREKKSVRAPIVASDE